MFLRDVVAAATPAERGRFRARSAPGVAGWGWKRALASASGRYCASRPGRPTPRPSPCLWRPYRTRPRGASVTPLVSCCNWLRGGWCARDDRLAVPAGAPERVPRGQVWVRSVADWLFRRERRGSCMPATRPLGSSIEIICELGDAKASLVIAEADGLDRRDHRAPELTSACSMGRGYEVSPCTAVRIRCYLTPSFLARCSPSCCTRVCSLLLEQGMTTRRWERWTPRIIFGRPSTTFEMGERPAASLLALVCALEG